MKTFLAILLLFSSICIAGPTTQPATPAVFTLHGVDDPTGPSVLAMDMSEALTMPRELRQWNDRRLSWLKTNGVNLIVDHGSHGFFILGWGTTLAPVRNERWTGDLGWIAATLAVPPAEASDWLHLQFRDDVALPMTFAYRTWRGATGLIRVSGMQQSPWRLKVDVRPVLENGDRNNSTVR